MYLCGLTKIRKDMINDNVLKKQLIKLNQIKYGHNLMKALFKDMALDRSVASKSSMISYFTMHSTGYRFSNDDPNFVYFHNISESRFERIKAALIDYGFVILDWRWSHVDHKNTFIHIEAIL